MDELEPEPEPKFDWIEVLIAMSEAVPSTFDIVIHLWKFYNSTPRQSLAAKNLTVYCIFLLLLNVFVTLPTSFPLQLYFDKAIYVYVKLTMQFFENYLLSLTAVFKFVIVAEIFIYFRKIPHLKQPPSDPGSRRGREFLRYFILGTVPPLIYTIVLNSKLFNYVWPHKDPLEVVFPTMKAIRIAILLPIFGIIWRLRFRTSRTSRTELLAKYPVQIRLLLMIAAQSILLNVAELIYSLFFAIAFPGVYTDAESLDATKEFENIALGLEGMVIAIYFTFRADTFQPVGFEESIAMQTTTED